MNSIIRNRMKSISALMSISFIILIAMVSPCAWGYSEEMRQGFLKGPWELIIAMGHEGREMSFSVTVSDEGKSEKLDVSFPVMGTPIQVRLKQYIPNLKWENSIVEQDGGEVVVAIKIKGIDNMVQEMLLNSADSERQSISSAVGGVAVKKVRDANILSQLAQKFQSGKTVGIVSVWLKDSKEPVEFLANLSEPVNIPETKYKLEVLEYLPHYSVDTETKEITNKSEKPLNPAVKIRIDDEENSYEQWVWSKNISPHAGKKLPLRVEFSEIDIGGKQGSYIVLAASDAEARIVFLKDQKVIIEKVEPGKDYSFLRKEYTFSIERVVNNAAIETNWASISEKLLNPALLTAVVYNDSEQEVVLELNKPSYQNTNFGRMVLLYRNQAPSSGMEN